jgi:hypothetical protein
LAKIGKRQETLTENEIVLKKVENRLLEEIEEYIRKLGLPEDFLTGMRTSYLLVDRSYIHPLRSHTTPELV